MVFYNDGADVGPANTFLEGDALAGTPATQPAGAWLTMLNHELVNLAVGAGLTPNKADNAQLLAAIKAFMRAGTKNRLDNAGFQIVTRTGGSVTGMTTSGFVTDRWRYDPGTSGSVTALCSSSPFSIMPGTPDGWNYDATTLNLNQTVAASGGTTPKLSQRREWVYRFAGQVVTVSCWLKVASGTLVVSPQFKQYFGATGSAAVTTIGPNWNVTTTWQLFTWTFTVPSIASKTVVSGSYVELIFGFPTSATFNVTLYQPQLELGGSFSFFEMPPAHVDEANCGRYFEASYWIPSKANTYEGASFANEGGSSAQGLSRKFRFLKAAIPAMRWYSPLDGGVGKFEWNGAGQTVLSTVATSVVGTGWPTISGSITNPSRAAAHWDADCEP